MSNDPTRLPPALNGPSVDKDRASGDSPVPSTSQVSMGPSPVTRTHTSDTVSGPPSFYRHPP